MSLMNRVALNERGNVRESQKIDKESSLNELKRRLNASLPPARIASLIAKNPIQARSEIRLSCNRVFDQCPWLAKTEQEKEDLIVQLLDYVFGFGPLEEMLNDETITEIMVNGTHSLYFERGGVLYRAEKAFYSDEQVYALIDKIVGPLGRRIDESSPMVDARLKEGHRVNAIIPPLALDGPVVTIRKFRARVFSLDEMEEMGSVDALVKQLLKWSVLQRCSVVVSGGTGSGKTTLLNALSCEIPFSERIITIEDSAELRFQNHPHVVRLESRGVNTEGVGEVTIRDLVINALRMRPDRIIVGECRGAEMLDALQAMNTGHEGSLTTLHANSPKEAISRLTTMVRFGVDLPVEVIEGQIASAIDLVVQTTRSSSGRRFVSQIVGYHFSSERKRCECSEYYRRPFFNNEGTWVKIPDFINQLSNTGVATQEEVRNWKKLASSLQ